MKKIIVTDIDGVVLKWQQMLPFFAQEKGIDLSDILKVQYSEEFIHTKDLFKCTLEFARELKKEYHNSIWMKYLNAYNDAIEVLNELKNNGYTFIAVTALEKSETTLRNRSFNLNVLFPGVFSEIHLTDNNKENAFYRILIEETKKGNEIIAYVDDLVNHINTFDNCVKDINDTGFSIAPLKFQLARGKRDNYIKEDLSNYRVNNWYDIKEIIKQKDK